MELLKGSKIIFRLSVTNEEKELVRKHENYQKHNCVNNLLNFFLDAGSGEIEWICNRERPKSDPLFETLNPIDGKISGAAAKSELIKSKLPNSVLSKIWKLSDVDCDGFLDIEEFALAMHLINIKIDGNELPNILPDHLIPPSHKN